MKLVRTDAVAATLWLLAAVYAWLHPVWLWDVIPYLALAKTWLGSSWPEAHGWVYEWVRTLPDFWREDLLQAHMHRVSVAADPESLRQLADFYHMNAGYPVLLAGLMAVGLGAGTSVQLVSLLAQALLGGTMYLWLRPRMLDAHGWRRAGWWLVWAVFLFNPFTLLSAQLSTPDGLAAGCLAAGVLTALRGHTRTAGILWMAAVLVRPLTGMGLLPLLVWALRCRRDLLPMLVAPLAVALLLAFGVDTYPLSVVWQHSFGFPYTYPQGVTLQWEPELFESTYMARLAEISAYDVAMWLAMGLATARMWMKDMPHRGLTTLLVACCMLQTLVFPSFSARYFAPLALAVLVLWLAPPRDSDTCR